MGSTANKIAGGMEWEQVAKEHQCLGWIPVVELSILGDQRGIPYGRIIIQSNPGAELGNHQSWHRNGRIPPLTFEKWEQQDYTPGLLLLVPSNAFLDYVGKAGRCGPSRIQYAGSINPR